jgi:hypothetical protein
MPAAQQNTVPNQRKAARRSVGGRPALKPFNPPEVLVGDVVYYQDGFYNPHNPAHPALVTEVGPQAVKLAIVAPDALNLRVLENDVRHRDDPEGARLSALAADEGSGYGVWWWPPEKPTHEEVRNLRVLLAVYGTEIAQARRAIEEKARREEQERQRLAEEAKRAGRPVDDDSDED